MERIWICGITIWESKINSDLKSKFAPSKYVIQKCFFLLHINSFKGDLRLTILGVNNMIFLRIAGIYQILQNCAIWRYLFVISVVVVSKKLDKDFCVIVPFCQCICVGENLLPLIAIRFLFVLWLVNWSKFSRHESLFAQGKKQPIWVVHPNVRR
jgi:hypothetical protein